MGNCQCSNDESPPKDIEEPNAIAVESKEPAFVSVPALQEDGYEKNGSDFKHTEEQHQPVKALTANINSESTKDTHGEINDDVISSFQVSHNGAASDDEAQASFASSTIDFEGKASMRQISCTSGGYEQFAHQDDQMTPTSSKKKFLMWGKMASQSGFFVSIDSSFNKALLKQLGIDASASDIKDQFYKIHKCMLESQLLDKSKVLGVFIPSERLKERIDEKSVVQYTKDKNIIPLLSLENGLRPLSKGVQLIDLKESFDDDLELASDNQLVGVRVQSVVKQPNAEGISSLVNQQFEIAKRIMDKELLPVLHISMDIKTAGKGEISRVAALAERRQCEEILFDKLLAALGELKAGERVAFNLTLPVNPNTYLSLVGHPNTVRVLGTPVGYHFANACSALEANFGLVGSFGNVLLGNMSSSSSSAESDEFHVVLESALQGVYDASVAVPTREMQTAKVGHTEGFFACLDSTGADIDKALARFRLGTWSDFDSDEKVIDRLHEMRSRIYTCTKFNGSRVIGVLMSIDTVSRSIKGKPSPLYLWQKKQVVPFLKIEHGLRGVKDGVQLMQDIPDIDKLLSKAVEAGIYGVKACTVIKKPNAAGIQAVVAQQFALSTKVMEKELVPVLHIEVENGNPDDKQACEDLLITILGESLMKLRPEQKIILWLSIPTTPNHYLSLRGHMNVIRIVGVSGGQDRKASCSALQQNFGTIGGFNRAFVQGMHWEQTHEELTAQIDKSCEEIFQSSREVPPKTVKTHKVSKQLGFFAALAHISVWKNEFNIAVTVRAGMSGRVSADWRGMFERIVTNPQFSSLHVVGVSLTRDHLDLKVMALPVTKYLWDEKQMVTFVKFDVGGLAPEQNGVQLMQEVGVSEQDALLDYAASNGVFGTTGLSKIRLPNSQGIREIVDQQLKIWRKVSSKGMTHCMMIFIDKGDAPEKEKCEKLLRQILLNALKTLPSNEAVMLNVILPASPGLYDCFISHPNVLRVLGSAGSFTINEACEALGENPGMVANFGTAMLEGLGTTQSYDEFSKAMRDTCTKIQKSIRPPAGRGSPASPSPSTPSSPAQKKARPKGKARSNGLETK